MFAEMLEKLKNKHVKKENEQEEMEAEFYEEHGIDYYDYIKQCREEYEDSFSER